MGYSSFLASKKDVCKKLVNKLLEKYEYVSLLGKHSSGKSISVTSRVTSISDGMGGECGFVVKIFNGSSYSEYSFSEIDENNLQTLVNDIVNKVTLSSSLLEHRVSVSQMRDETLVKDFIRPLEGRNYSLEEIVTKLVEFKDKIHSLSDKVIQAMARYSMTEVSSLFISRNRELTQNYSWVNVNIGAVVREGQNVQIGHDGANYNSIEKSLLEAESKLEKCVRLAEELLKAEAIVPGEYEIITEPSITGLIAHEAFGHGVEMDMFVKNRAKARDYVGEYVASPLVNMHDGASSILSAASYFFDDDGVLAHDTLIIKEGILQTGISDALSALQLGTEPTGNGRRESIKRKAYSRMTNTWFAPGESNVEDMIKSIKHGYLLAQTDNGMEDPKNWNIQCVCSYGREIKDGKFTGKIVAPVCMTGYVPDLLKSISMVSKEFEVIGSGYCGKGYKEWVPVSDGGPYLKAKCKLG